MERSLGAMFLSLWVPEACKPTHCVPRSWDLLGTTPRFRRPPIVRSVGVVIEALKDKMVLAGYNSALGDELNRLTRIPASVVRAVQVQVLGMDPYLSA